MNYIMQNFPKLTFTNRPVIQHCSELHKTVGTFPYKLKTATYKYVMTKL